LTRLRYYLEATTKFLAKIVEKESARLPGCGDSAPIRANHLEICKFKTATDEGYNLLIAAIRKFMVTSGAEETSVNTPRL
jgi:hypothetical protein